MVLAAPDLDDRRFQDLVDDAKRFVQQRCPEWSDHNVHDPGVTMIETFAWMVDQLLWRLNRVPDRLYITFLDLIGVRLFPAVAAHVQQTFWLSAPQQQTVTVPRGTGVATVRAQGIEPIVFTTLRSLDIVPTALLTARSSHGDTQLDHAEALAARSPFAAFAEQPQPGNVLSLGLTQPIPCNAVRLTIRATVEGIGVDPTNPPLLWEAFTTEGWRPCEVDRDETGGLNRDGEVVLHVPAGHTTSVVLGQRAAWIRARVLDAEEGQPVYSATPLIHSIQADTVGGTVEAVNAEEIVREVLGESTGVSGQQFSFERSPVVGGELRPVLEISDPEGAATDGQGWRTWQLVEDFGDAEAGDEVAVVDHVGGTVRLGPAVRLQDGSVRQHGACPPKGAVIRAASYRTGGGQRGNVAERSLVILTGSVPFITATVNRRAARGGRDGETLDNARLRGPVQLRHRGRAVTAGDYERIVLAGVRDVARVRAIPAGAGDAGGVRVLIVPMTSNGALAFGDLVPSDGTLQRVTEVLDQVRVLATRLIVEPPSYQGITVVARVRALAGTPTSDVQRLALEALQARFHPVTGGADGRGWPFGRAVHIGEIYATLQRLPGVDLVEDVRLFPADPVTGRRGEQSGRIDIDANALVFGYEHQVRVDPADPS